MFVCAGAPLLHVAFLWLQRAGTSLHRGAPASPRRGVSPCGAWV